MFSLSLVVQRGSCQCSEQHRPLLPPSPSLRRSARRRCMRVNCPRTAWPVWRPSTPKALAAAEHQIAEQQERVADLEAERDTYRELCGHLIEQAWPPTAPWPCRRSRSRPARARTAPTTSGTPPASSSRTWRWAGLWFDHPLVHRERVDYRRHHDEDEACPGAPVAGPRVTWRCRGRGRDGDREAGRVRANENLSIPRRKPGQHQDGVPARGCGARI